MQTPVTFIVAFVIVLALIGLVTWLIRRFAGNRLGGNAGRGRMPRLAVIDAAAVDGRRRLVLVRRDNVEHLLMIGGPTDIVVEPNIVRAAGREPARPTLGEMPPRPAAFPEDDELPLEPEQPIVATPEPAPHRPPRPAFAPEPRRPPPPPERRPAADPLAGFAPEPITREAPRREPPPMRPIPREPIAPRPAPRAAEPPRPPATEPAPHPATAASAEENLAEMAQRLEAALRRPGATPPAEPPAAPAATAAERPASEARPAAPTPSKGAFENLEEEMASLLGRPKSPS